MSKRKITEDYIIKYIGALLPNENKTITINQKIYQDLFASMNDSAFNDFMKSLQDGSSTLAIIAPNFGEQSLSVERNLEVAKKLGHNFFERIWITSTDGTPPYLSNIPYLIIDLPLRRQAQLLEKKISIPEDNKSVDDLTGQPTGKSKGSKISYPETQILAALDLEDCLTELLKVRGGDAGEFQASNTSISNSGGVSLKSIEPYATGVQATASLNILLKCMHLDNNV